MLQPSSHFSPACLTLSADSSQPTADRLAQSADSSHQSAEHRLALSADYMRETQPTYLSTNPRILDSSSSSTSSLPGELYKCALPGGVSVQQSDTGGDKCSDIVYTDLSNLQHIIRQQQQQLLSKLNKPVFVPPPPPAGADSPQTAVHTAGQKSPEKRQAAAGVEHHDHEESTSFMISDNNTEPNQSLKSPDIDPTLDSPADPKGNLPDPQEWKIKVRPDGSR